MKKILLIVFGLVFIFSCSDKNKSDLQKPLVLKDGILYQDSSSTKPFTGRNKSKMFDMIIEYDVVNGLKDGDFISYYPDGKVQMKGKIAKNKNTGLWLYYYKNGSVQTTGYFIDDKPDSIWTWFNEKGIKIEEGLLRLGKRDGEWKTYDSLGNLRVIKTFKEDTLIDSSKSK